MANIKNIEFKKSGKISGNKSFIFVKDKAAESYDSCRDIDPEYISVSARHFWGSLSNTTPENSTKNTLHNNLSCIFYVPRSKPKNNFMSGPMHQELCCLKK